MEYSLKFENLAGVIGGALAVFICGYFSHKCSHKSESGILKHGMFLHFLAWILLFATIGLIYVIVFINHKDQYIPLGFLILMSGVGCICSFLEAFGVRGKFDEEMIELKTPWTGSKKEKWSSLQSVKFDGQMKWYVLTFQNGTKMRLSNLLNGYGLVLDHARSIGFDC